MFTHKTVKSLMLMLVVVIALAGIGVLTVSAQDPATDETAPAGCPMMGQGMRGGMMQQRGMGMHHQQGGMGMRGMMGNPEACPFHMQMEAEGWQPGLGLHDPESCPFYQEYVNPETEPEATAEPQS